MNHVLVLLGRNLRVAVRDGTTISLIVIPPAAMVLLGLIALRGHLANALTGDSPIRYAAADAWIFASAAVLAGFSSSAAILMRFLDDRRSEKLGLLRACGASGGQLLSGYLITTFIVCTTVSFSVVVLSQLWALVAGQPVLSVVRWLQLLAGLILAAAFFAALTGLAATFMTSTGAFGAYCLIGNITVAFLSLSYGILGLLPFAQAAALVRAPLLYPSVVKLDSAGEILGTAVNIGGPWPGWITAMILVVWSAVLIALGAVRTTRASADWSLLESA